MVAFAGRKYAARSAPVFVGNNSYTVTSFTLVRRPKTVSRLLNHYRVTLYYSLRSPLTIALAVSGAGVPEGQAGEPVLEGRRLQVVLRARGLRVRGQELCCEDDELQGQGRAVGLQPRDPARVLGHGQARGRAQLVVRGVQAPAVLPVRALLRPQGLSGQPVQQLLLEPNR